MRHLPAFATVRAYDASVSHGKEGVSVPKDPKKNTETPIPDPDAAFARLEALAKKVLAVPKEKVKKPQPQS